VNYIQIKETQDANTYIDNIKRECKMTAQWFGSMFYYTNGKR